MFRTHTSNGCISAPGLAIATSTAFVQWANTFRFKANGRVSVAITTNDAGTTNAAKPSLLSAPVIAPYPSGTTKKAGVLANTKYRIYTLVGTLPAATYVSTTAVATAAPTYSWLASEDFDGTLDIANLDNAPLPDGNNQAAIGFVIVQNFSGSDFTPGTTALSAVTTTYIDNMYTQIAG